jgi:hypothetical protein
LSNELGRRENEEIHIDVSKRRRGQQAAFSVRHLGL